MVRLKIKVGPKGQIIIPKILRKAYNINEGGFVIVEPQEDGILIKGVSDPDEVLAWLKKRRRKISSRIGHIGELRNISLEEEFDA